MSWQLLGAVAPGTLTDARLQLHHAARIVGAVAATLLPAEPDDSHTNFRWEGGTLWGRQVGSHRAGLRFADLAAVVDDQVLPLDGSTLAELQRWLEARVDMPLAPREYNPFPAHPVGDGAELRKGDGAAFAELARYYEDIAQLLEEVPGQERSEIAVWPHHFDLARLILRRGGKQTVGVGLSPGDEGCPAPYLYVSPWPYPPREHLPELAVGVWNETWLGARLDADQLCAEGSGEAQEALARRFVDGAVRACHEALDRT